MNGNQLANLKISVQKNALITFIFADDVIQDIKQLCVNLRLLKVRYTVDFTGFLIDRFDQTSRRVSCITEELITAPNSSLPAIESKKR